MTALPDVPRIERWSEYGKDSEGKFVLHADHLTAMKQQRDTALREALALVREREADLLSCHKDDDCHTYAYMAGVIADDIQSVLIDGGER